MGFFSDFKKFALRGNVVDLAVAVIIGGAFGTITTSLVNDMLMPVLSLGSNKVDFKDKYLPLDWQRIKDLSKDPTQITNLPPLKEMQDNGVPTLRYGMFINTIINFAFVAFSVFLLVKLMTKLQKTAKEVPPAPNKEVELLTEIRDLLKAQKPPDRAEKKAS